MGLHPYIFTYYRSEKTIIMKLVTIKNATVISQYKNSPDDPDIVLKVYPSKTSNRKIVKFTVTTPQNDNNIKDGRLYEKCSLLVENDSEMINVRNTIKHNALLSLKGYEESFKTTSGHYIRTIRITNINILSGGVNLIDDLPPALDEEEE
jgi:hypothetical protein